MRSLFDWLRSQPYVRANGIGITGFCWGGGITYDTAVNIPELGAAVPFYGRNPEPIDSVANVKAPVLAFYGGEDARINAGIPAMEEAMKKNGVEGELYIEEKGPHGIGLGQKLKEKSAWPTKLEEWLKGRGFLPK